MLSPSKQKRSNRIRYKLKKSNRDSLRLSIYKSSKHLYAQLIDDKKGITLCSSSSLKKDKSKNTCNIENAKIIGTEIAKAAKEKGVKNVYLDRGPNIYHGIIKTIAEEARSNGLISVSYTHLRAHET